MKEILARNLPLYILEASIYKRNAYQKPVLIEKNPYSKPLCIKQILTRRPGRHGGGPADRPSGGSLASPASCQAPGNLGPQTRPCQRTARTGQPAAEPQKQETLEKTKKPIFGPGPISPETLVFLVSSVFLVFGFLVFGFWFLFFLVSGS